MRLLLDTHIWLWLVLRDARLGQARRRAIDRAAADGALFVSPITAWEIVTLDRRGRIDLGEPVEHWISDALTAPGLSVAPFTPQIAVASVRLPDTFHGDPADRILIATAIEIRARLVTVDERILAASKALSLPVFS